MHNMNFKFYLLRYKNYKYLKKQNFNKKNVSIFLL